MPRENLQEDIIVPKEFIFRGVPNVFKPKRPLPDSRFFDPANTWYMYDNTPLKESLEKFARFPIATSFENNEPRLLLVAVDVQSGASVLFDSYEKEDGRRKSGYGRYDAIKYDRSSAGDKPIEKSYEHIISYDDGITSDFVLASCSVPVNYDFTKLEVKINNWLQMEIQDKYPVPQVILTLLVTMSRLKIRIYAISGMVGLLANTPLRQAILAHLNYWNKVKKVEQVPGLRVGIVNLHPLEQDHIPTDYDGVVDRKNDIIYHDRTEFDEYVAVLLSEYQSASKNIDCIGS